MMAYIGCNHWGCRIPVGTRASTVLGQLGNVPRRFFYGPGIENTDLTLLKNISLGASRTLQVRLEAFNVFNRAQFYGPGAVDGNVASSTFGQIVRAAAPRLIQLAAKFTF